MTIAKRKEVYSGTLSNIETRTDGDLTLLVANLTKVIKGETIVTTVIAANEFADAVRDIFVEGNSVRLYGVRSTAKLAPGENPNRFVVIGPDLTKRNQVRLAERAAREAQAQPAKMKRPMSPAQQASWERFRATYRTRKPETADAVAL